MLIQGLSLSLFGFLGGGLRFANRFRSYGLHLFRWDCLWLCQLCTTSKVGAKGVSCSYSEDSPSTHLCGIPPRSSLELLEQAGYSDACLPGDHDQLAFSLRHSLPSFHEKFSFLLATNKRREHGL